MFCSLNGNKIVLPIDWRLLSVDVDLKYKHHKNLTIIMSEYDSHGIFYSGGNLFFIQDIVKHTLHNLVQAGLVQI